MRLPNIDKLSITLITDNYYDVLRKDEKVAHRFGVWNQDQYPPLLAEMGLSFYIEVSQGNKHQSLLFDFSYTPKALLNNLRVLTIDLSKVKTLVLSHGHKDHWGGLLAMLKKYRKSMPEKIELFVGEETFYPRWLVFDNGHKIDFDRLNADKVKGYDIKITEVREPTLLAKMVLLTGEILQTTDFEKGSPILCVEKDKVMPDSFIGEQSLIFKLKDKGLVVVTSCAHRGIINTVNYAQKITGERNVHAILGGFHLSGAKPEVRDATIQSLQDINPDFIIPMHCTGMEAAGIIAEQMPDKYVVTTVGSRYLF